MKTFLKHNWQWFLHGAVLVGLIVAGTKYINGGEFTKAIRQFNFWYAPLIVGFTLVYMFIKGWRLALPLRATEKVDPWVVVRAYFASYGATLLPGGVTALAAMLKQANVPLGASAATVLLASLLDQVFFLSSSIIAALWVPFVRPPALIALGFLVFAGVLLGVKLTRLWIHVAIDAVMDMLGVLDKWRSFLDSLKLALFPYIVVPAFGLTLLAAVPMVAALNAAVSSVGADVTLATALLAYTLSSLLGRITPLPGGVGVTEATMIGLLSQSIPTGQAAAAVLVFRIGTTLLAGAIGALLYFLGGWRGEKERAT